MNSLIVKKEADKYFSFTLNGDVSGQILNTRNDLTIVGKYGHFKTSNGANLIKEQNILYSEVTIIDGSTSVVPTSARDLMLKLAAVGYWEWNGNGGGGGSGVNRFDYLFDTFQYFGNDGKGIKVNESQLKLIPYDLPDTSKLDELPDILTPYLYVRVKGDGSGYELVDYVASLPIFDYVVYDFLADPSVFTLPVGAKPFLVFINKVVHSDWTFLGDEITISNYPLSTGYTDEVVINYTI